MPGGTYTLLLALDEPTTLTVGALGERRLDAGHYAYTGSALGTGGFARVDRHRAVASGANDTRHWHVDYLLGADASRLVDVVRTPGEDRECAVARALSREFDRVPGFGASDCDCASHLVHAPAADALAAAVRDAHEPGPATAGDG